MCNHLIQSLITIFRLLNSHNLDLIELVEAVESAHILAV